MADEFDFAELIGAPIAALNEAEAESAARFAELVMEYAIDDGGSQEGGDSAQKRAVGKLRELTFDVPRIGSDGRVEARRINMPLIQMMPLGGVSIDQVTLQYGLTLSAQAPPSARARGPEVSFTQGHALRLRGQMARSMATDPGPSRSAVDANIMIEIKLRQMDLPQGVLDLLQHTQGGRDEPVPDGGEGDGKGSGIGAGVGEGGTTAPGPDPTPDPDPNPDPDPGPGNPRMISADLAEISGRALVPGEVIDAIVRVNLRDGLSRETAFDVTSSPPGVLGVRSRGSDAEIRETGFLRLRLRVNKAIEKLDPTARVGIDIHASLARATYTDTVFLPLPRPNSEIGRRG